MYWFKDCTGKEIITVYNSSTKGKNNNMNRTPPILTNTDFY
jgi:hypothetical protein